MKKLKIAMPGAGSGFVLSIAKELLHDPVFTDAEFVLMDPDRERLDAAFEAVRDILRGAETGVRVRATTDRTDALDGANYVITSCEKDRYFNWISDLRIPMKYGVTQMVGENGGPGGLIHGMRNICMFMDIVRDMEKYAPDAWLMNFTNPMSILCTYFKNYTKVKALGFCHQVHGSFGLIAEELGLEPGELEVITGGVNHFNWLFDIRKRGTGVSFKEEFFRLVRESKYWKEKGDMIPEQMFTLDILNVFGMYPVGYDEHIVEYMSCFYDSSEWPKYGYECLVGRYEKLVAEKHHTLEAQRLLGQSYVNPPFPRNPDHPYYAENPCRVISALETNTPAYFDAINIVNHGAVGNLPANAIVDVPGLAIGGAVRSVYVGELPEGPCEMVRRQITLHEMIARAAAEGSDDLAVQALCLDPYVHSINQAKNIWHDYRERYRKELTTFR